MAKLWIDVTFFIRWTRPPVGIIRVEQELIQWAAQHLENIGFFEYNSVDQSFKIVESHQVLFRSPQQLTLSDPIKKTRWIVKPQIEEMKNAIKEIVRAHYRFFLLFINTAYHFRISRFLRKYISKLKNLFAASEKPSTPTPVPNKEIVHPFQENDRILCGGLTWTYANINNSIALIKQSIKLTYYGFCYDLIPVKFPHLCLSDSDHYLVYFTTLSQSADHIFCISKSTQNDFKQFLQTRQLHCPMTSVVTLGSEITRGNNELSCPLKSLIGTEYILLVSTIKKRKNHDCIYKSILYLLENGYKNLPKFIFVGMKGWGLNDFFVDLALDPKIKNHILILSEISDAELSALYQNALFTVFPSFYEGWGLPIAESLNYGKLAIVSSTSSMPEVGGDLVDYIHPYDTLSWANQIRFYLDNRQALAERETRIREHYQPNSWHHFCVQVFNQITVFNQIEAQG